MSLSCSNALLPSSAAAEHGKHPGGGASASTNKSSAAAKALAAETVATATTTTTSAPYATPTRPGGMAAVTPSTLTGSPDSGSSSSQEDSSAATAPRANGGSARREDDAIVSASSAEETAAESAAASSMADMAGAATASLPAFAVNPRPPMSSAAKKISAAVSATPSIHLGPRVSPAVRRLNSSATPIVAGAGGGTSSASRKPLRMRGIPSSVSAPPSAVAAGAKRGDCPSTPVAGNSHHSNIPPPPSSFLAAKISPLRSKRNGEKSSVKGAPATASAAMAPREKTPPLPTASDNLDPTKLSPATFLSPRTPKQWTHFDKGAKSSGLTPRFTPGLTPTNFASDFGKGHKKEGSLNAMDNVFAWLQSPGGQSLFSPGGSLSLSVTNTPRGMYGFCGTKTPTSGAPKLAPSPSRLHRDHAHLFAELEAGGDLGVNTPKVRDADRSMICISPLASKRSGKGKNGAGGTTLAGVPDTPMSINFSEVFASPRLPTPRLSRSMTAPAGMLAVKKEDGLSTSEGHMASPVTSALHTAERDINLDDDLNALLQLAETTTPGGRPMTFMSPLLSNSLRRVTNGDGMVRNGVAPPSSLQLPIISGSSLTDGSSPQTKLTRKGSSSGRNISPPQLAIRSSSSSSALDRSSPVKSSLKKKSKKRKSPTPTTSSPDQHQPQRPGYPYPNMAHYRHPHAPPPNHGYYQYSGYSGHPGGTHPLHQYSYPSTGHPAPQQHYAYSEQTKAGKAAATKSSSPTTVSPAKPSRKKSKSTKKRSKSSSTQSKASNKSPTKAPDAIKSKSSRPATPSGTGKRVRKSSAKAAGASKKAKTAVCDPADKERISAAIYAVNTVYGDGTEKEKKLAEATLRGVTMRPSKKWQAQLYYAGKSRYIGVFDSKEKASLAYEIAREVLKTDKGEDGPANAEETDRNVALARKAAFAGVNEHCGT
eukprot:CAMPEP_0183732530 /NCGR_PEP_ID=MMETSP0737-20130205/38657_1 /TAXON_ID=385413 /ORGANISM="Thalassiosira miniscula, Strain CCMP1093" /LENGTH=934 /DNA_ID=CAMNT_0025965559 /DNA_START=410 /DNA_END=3214 /DNA_ORIENTATION=-